MELTYARAVKPSKGPARVPPGPQLYPALIGGPGIWAPLFPIPFPLAWWYRGGCKGPGYPRRGPSYLRPGGQLGPRWGLTPGNLHVSLGTLVSGRTFDPRGTREFKHPAIGTLTFWARGRAFRPRENSFPPKGALGKKDQGGRYAAATHGAPLTSVGKKPRFGARV